MSKDAVTITGTLSEVKEVITSEKGMAQQIGLSVKRIDNATQEVAEAIYPCVIFGENIGKVNAKSKLNDVVEARCFLGSRLNATNPDRPFWNLYLSVIEVKTILASKPLKAKGK